MSIRSLSSCFAIMLALAPTALAQPAGRILEQKFFPGEAQKVSISMALGDLRIEGSDGPNIEIVLSINCQAGDSKCQNRADRVELAPRVSRKRFKLGVKKTTRVFLRGVGASMVVRLPRHLPVEIDLRAGDVSVSGLSNDLELDAAGGSVDVVYDQAKVGKVDVNVTVGKARLMVGGGEIKGTGFPESLKWQGPGEADIEIDMASGKVEIRQK